MQRSANRPLSACPCALWPAPRRLRAPARRAQLPADTSKERGKGANKKQHHKSERARACACPLAPRTGARAGATVARRYGGGRGWGRRSSCPSDGRRAERWLRRRGGRASRRSGATGGPALTVRTRRSCYSTMPARSRPSCSKPLCRTMKIGQFIVLCRQLTAQSGHFAAQRRVVGAQGRVLASPFGRRIAPLGHRLRRGVVRLRAPTMARQVGVEQAAMRLPSHSTETRG